MTTSTIRRRLSGALVLAAVQAPVTEVATAEDFAGLVDIGNGRKVYLACRGEGAPTVVLISGGWEAGWNWTYALTPNDPVQALAHDAFSTGGGNPQKLDTAVFPAIAAFTRVRLYDRSSSRNW
jgi:hypothetical protein